MRKALRGEKQRNSGERNKARSLFILRFGLQVMDSRVPRRTTFNSASHHSHRVQTWTHTHTRQHKAVAADRPPLCIRQAMPHL